MTDALAVGSITQLTETGTLTQFAPLTRDIVDCAQFAQPDPRDARIAELEAALRDVYRRVAKHRPLAFQDVLIMRTIDAALMPSPERDMAITTEEMDA